MKTPFHNDIIELLDRSGIPMADRELWLGILEAQSEAVQVVFLRIFYGQEELLPAITENLRLKISALGDPSKVEDVFEQEKKMFAEALGVSNNPVTIQEV